MGVEQKYIRPVATVAIVLVHCKMLRFRLSLLIHLLEALIYILFKHFDATVPPSKIEVEAIERA